MVAARLLLRLVRCEARQPNARVVQVHTMHVRNGEVSATAKWRADVAKKCARNERAKAQCQRSLTAVGAPKRAQNECLALQRGISPPRSPPACAWQQHEPGSPLASSCAGAQSTTAGCRSSGSPHARRWCAAGAAKVHPVSTSSLAESATRRTSRHRKNTASTVHSPSGGTPAVWYLQGRA